MEKPYQCRFCGQSFKRSDHLRRHNNLHTRQDKYACPCGETFIRKDVLAQHLRSCERLQARPSKDLGRMRAKATRAKKACDRCANAKVKCDSQEPCGRCRAKLWSCEYTRGGYLDPYREYMVAHSRESTSQERILSTPSTHTSLESDPDDLVPVDPMLAVDKPQPLSLQQAGPSWQSEREMTGMTVSWPQARTDLSSCEALDLDHLNQDRMSSDVMFDILHDTSGSAGVASWFLEPLGLTEQPLVGEDFPDLAEGAASSQTSYSQQGAHRHLSEPSSATECPRRPAFPRRGFSLEQNDPVEAKCAAIRSLLQTSDPAFSEGLVTTCMTRSKILLCHRLYGTHFQYHFPILHSPTHRFTEASPLLILAMVLAGAHYATDIMEPAIISQFALKLLMVVQTQPHEIALGTPELSTLQACVIICALLACSRDSIANQSWPIHFGRILSMSERLGIFDAEGLVDYQSLTVETFDWSSWVERESHRRVACQVFCQDMASCVFLGRPPALSPLSVDVTLPCYESAWEADSAEECLRRLQNTPVQVSISTALRTLRKEDNSGFPVLEASGYGMFVLINGLHSFIFHITREENIPLFSRHIYNPQPTVNASCFTGAAVVTDRLKTDFSPSTIDAVADDLIRTHGVPAIQEIAFALNAWRSSWDSRVFGDNQSDGQNFSADPMPFWHLAKLFIVLYLLGDLHTGSSEMRIPRARVGDTKGKLLVQEGIVSWLRKLGTDQSERPDQTATAVTDPSTGEQDGSRVLLLMRPLSEISPA